MRKHTITAAIVACLLSTSNTVLPAQTSQPPFVPMTGSQRLSQYFKNTFSPMSFVTSGASAGIGQWRNRPRAWQQGGEGYGRRYASSYAEHIVQETLIFGASSVLHEDNRFIPSGQAGKWNRVKYAVASTFLARHDDGTRHLSISRLAGFAGAALVSRMWQPTSHHIFRSGTINFGISLSVATGFNVAREFLPFIFNRK